MRLILGLFVQSLGYYKSSVATKLVMCQTASDQRLVMLIVNTGGFAIQPTLSRIQMRLGKYCFPLSSEPSAGRWSNYVIVMKLFPEKNAVGEQKFNDDNSDSFSLFITDCVYLLVWYFVKYTYWRSCMELDEKMHITVICVL